MARILSIATSVPQNKISSDVAEQLLLEQVARWGRTPDGFVKILHNTGIESRHTVYTPDAVIEDHPLGQRNSDYQTTSIELAENLVEQALADARLKPKDIDAIICVSCTGFMLPSIDAYLINSLEMKPDVRRIPITELGCSAGAAALIRAREQLLAYPGSHVLVLSVELPSLTFQPSDERMAQLISSLIFADGAAAVVVGPDDSGSGPILLGSRTYTIPNTLGEMGYVLDENGFHIVLSPLVPDLVCQSLGEELDRLLQAHDASRADLYWYAIHPAGPKVLEMIADDLNLNDSELAASWQVLRDYGNMSSATVLFVLSEMLQDPPAEAGDLGVIAAFGPGISGELVLARWDD
jgi:predicted naringenin-chalcone synthase